MNNDKAKIHDDASSQLKMNNPARYDAFTFYSLTAISFLESTVGTYVDNLLPFFKDDNYVSHWLKTVWLPEEAEHGEITESYINSTWPEFWWNDGYSEFLRYYEPCCEHEQLRPTPALEALARCVTETETSMIYRCISSYTTDPSLKVLMRKMSTDEARHYGYFRDVFDKHQSHEKNSLWKMARTTIARSALVRDEDLALAFKPLNQNWQDAMPFEPMTYDQFLLKAGEVMRLHFPYEEAKRMLFRPLRSGSWYDKILVGFLAAIVRRQFPNTTGSVA